MYFKDFRDYLYKLGKQGMLLRVNREVSPQFGMAAGIYKTGETNGPAPLFKNVKATQGGRSPVVCLQRRGCSLSPCKLKKANCLNDTHDRGALW